MKKENELNVLDLMQVKGVQRMFIASTQTVELFATQVQ